MSDLTIPVPSGTIRGYLAVPDGAGPWPGVVVIHEAFGLTDDIRRQADRFAADGYLALAPDLYSWASTPRCLVTTMRAMFTGQGRAFGDIDGARTMLLQDSRCTGKVGVIGFCMGGGFAILVANKGFDVSAPNYGQVPRNAAQKLQGSCPMVASYGAKDRSLRGAAGKLEKALQALDVPHDVKEYPSAAHAFLFEHVGSSHPVLEKVFQVAYDPEVAADAWRRIFRFFDTYLKQEAT